MSGLSSSFGKIKTATDRLSARLTARVNDVTSLLETHGSQVADLLTAIEKSGVKSPVISEAVRKIEDAQSLLLHEKTGVLAEIGNIAAHLSAINPEAVSVDVPGENVAISAPVTAPAPPVLDALFSLPLPFPLEWREDTAFKSGETCFDGNAVYVALKDNEREEPDSNPDIWKLVIAAPKDDFRAEQGETGENGPSGPDAAITFSEKEPETAPAPPVSEVKTEEEAKEPETAPETAPKTKTGKDKGTLAETPETAKEPVPPVSAPNGSESVVTSDTPSGNGTDGGFTEFSDQPTISEESNRTEG
jgi:hypothetical protein